MQLNFAKKRILHERNSISAVAKLNFTQKNLFLIWQVFLFGENFFHESEIEIRLRDLDFHLGKVQFHFGEIDMEKYRIFCLPI